MFVARRQISIKYEVSRDMITKFNASQSLQITMADMTSYGLTDRLNIPATGITWNAAARFVNWLNTSTGNQTAHKFTTNRVEDNLTMWTAAEAGYNASNPFRNSLAKYFLPSADEWYKAAYYDPVIDTCWISCRQFLLRWICLSSGAIDVVMAQVAIDTIPDKRRFLSNNFHDP